MPNFALIKDGVVRNIIVASQQFVDDYCQVFDSCIAYEDGTYVGPGFYYDGEVFTAPEPEEEE